MIRLKFRIITACFALVIISTSCAVSQEKIDLSKRYQINKDGSYITFTTSMAGFPVIKGSLSAYQGTIFYNPDDVKSTSATIRFGASGLSTAHDKRDEQLHGSEFLDTEAFPGMWFQGDEVEINDNGFNLNGILNIKNISKPVSIEIKTPNLMSMNRQDMMMLSGSLQINRRDFDLGTTGAWASNPMLGDEIAINFTFLCFSYTVDYLKALYVKDTERGGHPVGLVYQEVVDNGVKSGTKLAKSLMKDDKYKSDNWLTNLANIGWILMVDGYGEESLVFYEMALDQNPNHLISLLRLGDAYTIAGQNDKALSHFKKEWNIPARARFTHIPEMIRKLSGDFDLKDMK